MSAVMSTLSMLSGGRRARRKLAHSSGRKSGQFSDACEERLRSHGDLQHQQRSASLHTLETSGTGAGVVNLENLEAKMASIEVSLAGSRRRSAGVVGGDALSDKDNLIESLKKQLSASLSAARLAQAQAACACGGGAGAAGGAGGALSGEERRALRERAAAVRADVEARRHALHELRRRLERTHVTDNIDSRIQQAELQYQAGREELELQALREQARALALLLERPAVPLAPAYAPLYPLVRERGGAVRLVCATPCAGAWRAGPAGAAGDGGAGGGGGLCVRWAAPSCGLEVGDRLVEVDGVSVVACCDEYELPGAGDADAGAAGDGGDVQRVLVLRGGSPPAAPQGAAAAAAAALAQAQSDNTRLTHRISYLEEQVHELLHAHHQLQSVSSNDSCITVNKTKKNVTNISITSEPAGGVGELQVFQKGPDVTALVARLPAADAPLPLLLRPRSSASGASSRAASAASPRASPRPHHYAAETDAALRCIERNQRHLERQRRARRAPSAPADTDLRDLRDMRDARAHEDAAERIQESIKKTNWAERKTLSIIEQLKRSQRLRKMKKNDSSEDIPLDSEKHYMYHRIDGKVLENAHKSCRRTSKSHSRSAKSSEMESECSDYPNGELYYSSPRIDYSSEGGHWARRARADGDGRARPTPPRKPLRLSLHKARSAHELAAPEPAHAHAHAHDADKKPVKRTHAHAGERRERDGARATPRPARKLQPALSAPATPAPVPPRVHHWC